MPTVSSGNITPGTGVVTYPDNPADPLGITSGVTSAISTGSSSTIRIGGQNLGTGVGLFAGVAGTETVLLDFLSITAGSGIAISTESNTLILSATGTVSSQLNDLGGVLAVPKGGTGLSTIPTNAILIGNGTNAMIPLPLPISANQVLTWNGGDYVWTTPVVNNNTGTVTSVTITPGPSGLVSVIGNPITSSGTYTIDVNESAFNLNNITGTLSVAKGGTGTTTFTSKGLLYGNGAGALQTVAAPSSSGQVLSYNGSSFAWTTPATIPANLLTSVTLAGDQVVAVTGGPTSSSTVAYTLATQPSGVTSGTYTNATVTVDQYGRVTAASSGTSGSTITAVNENNGGGARVFDDTTSTATQFNFRRIQTSPALTATENTGYVMLSVNNIPVNEGGTGATSFVSNSLLVGNGTSAITSTTAPSAPNTSLIWNGTGFAWASALQNVTVTGTNGITVAQSTDSNGQPVFGLSYNAAQTSINSFTGTTSVTKGGTGQTSFSANSVLLGNGTSGLLSTTVPTTANTALTWNGTGFVWSTIPTNSLTNFTISSDSTINVTNGAVSSSGSTVVLSLGSTSVIPNTYTNPTITVDQTGRITSASNGATPLISAANYSTGGAKVYDDTVTGQALKFRTIQTNAALTATQTAYGITLDVANISVPQGGTGLSTVPVNSLLVGNGTSALTATPAPADAGTFLSWNGTSYEFDTVLSDVTVVGSSTVVVSESTDSNNQPVFTLGVNPAQISINGLNGTLGVAGGGTGATTLTQNGLLIGNGTSAVTSVVTPTTAGTFLSWNGSGFEWDSIATGGTGTVTSVNITTGTGLVATGGPITTSGSFVLSIDPTVLNLNNFTGVLSPALGGTGLASLPANAVLIGNGSSNITSAPVPNTANQVLTWDGAEYTWAIPTSTSGVTSVNIAGGSNKVSVSGGPITSTGTLVVDVVEANLNLANLGGTLPISSGGTGLNAIGAAGEVLAVSSDGTDLVWVNPNAAAGGTVTSVAVTGATGRVAVTGSPITVSGTINVDVVESGLNIGAMAGTLGTTQGGTGLTSLGTAGQIAAVNSNATALTWVTPFSGVVAGSNQVSVSTTNGVATVNVDTANMVISTMAGTLGTGQGGTGLTTVGANGQVMTASNGTLVWATPGSVTSVGITAGSDQITVTGGPITSSGNITVDVNTANLNISEMTGVLPVNMGGTGIATYGAPNQVLATNSIGTGLVWVDQGSGTAGTGTVTSVAVAASSNKLTVTGSPITSSGTINIDVVESNLDLSQIGGQVGITQGGTGLTTLGTAGQVLTVNSNGTGLQWSTVSGSGTVTSVGITAGSNKLTVSGSPITTNGTITVDVNPANISLTALAGTLGTTQGGTGITTLGSAGQVLTVNSGGTGLVYSSVAASNVTGLAAVATTGSYTSLTNTPTIPAAQVNADWNASSGVAQILNKPTIPTAYTLPTASSSVLGGVMVGSGLAINSGVLSATNTNTGTVTSVGLTAGSNKVSVSGSPITSSGSITVDVNPANISLTALSGTLATTQGGTGLTSLGTAGQVLAVNAGATGLTWVAPSTYTLPAATTSTLGGVIVGSGLSISSGVLSATNTNTGTVTSVGLTAGSNKVSVSGSPITGSGSITVDVVPANIAITALSGTLGTTAGGTGLTTLGTAGQVLTVNSGGTGLQWSTPTAGGTGTVTSVGLTAGSSAITVTGGPVTSSGSITVDVNQANLNVGNMTGTLGFAHGGTGLTALGTAGQVLTVNSGATAAQWSTLSVAASNVTGLATVATSGSYNDLANKPTITSGTVTSVALAGDSSSIISFTGGPITSSGTITAAINQANISLPNLGGTLTTAQGGTGLTSLGTAGQVLAVNSGGTGLVWTTPAVGGGSGTVTSVGATSSDSSITVTSSPITTSGTIGLTVNQAVLNVGNMTGTLGTGHGGTGLTSIGTAGQVLAVNSGGTGLTWTTPATGGSGGSPASSLPSGSFQFTVTVAANGTSVTSVQSLPAGWSAVNAGSGVITVTHNVGRYPYALYYVSPNNATTPTVWQVTPATYAAGVFDIPDNGSGQPSTSAFNITVTSATSKCVANGTAIINVMF
jgi:hypothetical protein